MRRLGINLVVLFTAVLVGALTGCTPAPYHDEIVVIVPVPVSVPDPCPRHPPLPPAPPPVVTPAPTLPRNTPIAPQQDSVTTATKTRDRAPSPARGAVRVDRTGESRQPTGSTTPRGEDGARTSSKTRGR